MLVLEAFDTLINQSSGSRPLRTMAGLDFGLGLLNDAVDPIRLGLINSLGLSDGPQA